MDKKFLQFNVNITGNPTKTVKRYVWETHRKKA